MWLNPFLGQKPTLFPFSSKSALVTKKLGDYESCGAIYGCIGNVLHLLGEFEEAIRFHSWVSAGSSSTPHELSPRRSIKMVFSLIYFLATFSDERERTGTGIEESIRSHPVAPKQQTGLTWSHAAPM